MTAPAAPSTPAAIAPDLLERDRRRIRALAARRAWLGYLDDAATASAKRAHLEAAIDAAWAVYIRHVRMATPEAQGSPDTDTSCAGCGTRLVATRTRELGLCSACAEGSRADRAAQDGRTCAYAGCTDLLEAGRGGKGLCGKHYFAVYGAERRRHRRKARTAALPPSEARRDAAGTITTPTTGVGRGGR